MGLGFENPVQGLLVSAKLEEHVRLGVHEIAFLRHERVCLRAAFQGALQPRLPCVFASRHEVGVVVQDIGILDRPQAPLKGVF